MITPYNVTRHELIGLRAKVSASSCRNYVGIEGVVVDETQNMLYIMGGDGRIRAVPKASATFKFMLPDGTIVEVEGRAILGRPEDRVKKAIKKRW